MIASTEIDRLKTSISLQSYVMADLGRPQMHTSSVWLFRCPFGHRDDTASLAVYADNHFFCYSCSARGTILDYVMRRMDINFKAALEFLGAKNDLPKYKPPPIELKPEAVLNLKDAERYHYDVAKVKPYLEQRHICDSVIESNLIGARPWTHTYIDTTGRRWDFSGHFVTLPYIYAGRFYAFNSRRDDASVLASMKAVGERHHIDMIEYLKIDLAEKMDKAPSEISLEKVLHFAFSPRFHRPAGTHVSAYGLENVLRIEGDHIAYPRLPFLIISEGEFNSLSAQSLGFPAIALKPGQGVNLRRLTQNIRLVLVAVDSDEAGLSYAEKVLAMLSSDASKARLMIMPPGFNDLNDLHQQDELKTYLTSRPFFLEPLYPPGERHAPAPF